MTVSKEEAREITSEIEIAVNAILAKHEATPVTLDENGVNTSSKEALVYLSSRWMFDLPENLLGKKVVINGKSYTFAGISPTRTKYPFAFKDDAGAEWFFQEGTKKYLVEEAK
jgi:hypothetical protein